MAVTTQKTLTSSWQAIATAGEVRFRPAGEHCFWALTESTTAPTLAEGDLALSRSPVSMTLSGAERLWVKGAGVVYVTADSPV